MHGEIDLRFRFFPGPPAVVEVDIMVRSMGPISEVDMVSVGTTEE